MYTPTAVEQGEEGGRDREAEDNAGTRRQTSGSSSSPVLLREELGMDGTNQKRKKSLVASHPQPLPASCSLSFRHFIHPVSVLG